MSKKGYHFLDDPLIFPDHGDWMFLLAIFADKAFDKML